MRSRRSIALVFGVVLLAVAATLLALPELIRHVAIARIQAMTDRHVSIDRVDLDILRSRLAVRGFRLAERAGGTAFADFEQLDIRLDIPSLLRGHLWIHELILRSPAVRVVRFPTNEFNLSDLIRSSGETSRPFDVTVDRFVLAGGTVTLEDRALPEWRTWTSEQIAIEAHNLSTRRDDGSAVGTSVTGGAPVTVEVQGLRLYPIHLQATVTVEGLDLALARLYLPPDAPVVLDRGRASTSVRVALDARDGLRIDATGRLQDVALARPSGGEPVALAPEVTARLSGLAFQGGELRLGQLEIAGSAAVLDPTATSAGRYVPASVRASVADFTWPISTPARLDLLTSVPGRGKLAVSGMLRPPTAPSELRLRVADFDLAPWGGFLPASVRVTGVAEADLHVNEPLAGDLPARVRGSAAVKRLGVADAHNRKFLGARRVEATGLRVQWPARFTIEQLLVSGPSGIVERDRAGGFPLLDLWGRPARSPGATQAANPGKAPASTLPPLAVEVGRIALRDGAVAWRDEAITPPVRLDLMQIEATVTGAGWPPRGPLGVRATLRPPRGGQLQLAGRVSADPLTADVRLVTKDADLAPYQAYLPTTARIGGSADLDLAVLVPAPSEGSTTVRGRAALSRVEVRDGERTVMRIERAAATGLDVEWPRRVAVSRLALQRPWILLERDETGALPLRALLTTRGGGGAPPAGSDHHDDGAVAVALGQIAVDEGGARVVDRSVSPAFAVDLQRLALRMEGLSTAPAQPARVELTGQLGAAAELALSGTVGPLRGPLRADVKADLRGFAVPRVNSYLLRHVAWKAREGSLTTSLRCRIRGDVLDARTDIRLSQLQLVRAGAHDEAQARIGLPLGLIVALMKDARGDIRVSVPVGGRLGDPRFDFTEAVWSAVRTVAINTITLPVSWIGRMQVSRDSRIQGIQIDPVRFERGTAALTPEGQAQVARLAAFLGQVPEVRVMLTPVVSSADRAELRRPALDATIDRVASEARISPEAAAARLFKQRFPDRQPPEGPEAILAELVESESTSTVDASGLATRRVETVRATLKQAGIDAARLPESKFVERQEAADGGIALDLVEPDSPRRPQLRALLRRLGATITGADPGEE